MSEERKTKKKLSLHGSDAPAAGLSVVPRPWWEYHSRPFCPRAVPTERSGMTDGELQRVADTGRKTILKQSTAFASSRSAVMKESKW